MLLSNHILPQSLLEFGPAIQALGVRTSLEAMEHVKETRLQKPSKPSHAINVSFGEIGLKTTRPFGDWDLRLGTKHSSFAMSCPVCCTKEVALLVSDLQSNPAFKKFLHFIEGFNPRQNWAGKFPATASRC